MWGREYGVWCLFFWLERVRFIQSLAFETVGSLGSASVQKPEAWAHDNGPTRHDRMKAPEPHYLQLSPQSP